MAQPKQTAEDIRFGIVTMNALPPLLFSNGAAMTLVWLLCG